MSKAMTTQTLVLLASLSVPLLETLVLLASLSVPLFIRTLLNNDANDVWVNLRVEGKNTNVR